MNKTDLESHATSLGLVPAGDRIRLEERLVYEFQRHFNNYRMPADTNSTTNSTTNADVPDHVRKILEEGK